MVDPDEEARAVAYRLSCVARKQSIRAAGEALAPSLGADVAAAWRPLLLALMDQTTVCDDEVGDLAQLGQLTH